MSSETETTPTKLAIPAIILATGFALIFINNPFQTPLLFVGFQALVFTIIFSLSYVLDSQSSGPSQNVEYAGEDSEWVYE